MRSVSGIRGIVGDDLTPQVVFDHASTFGSQIGRAKVAVGRDTRPSSEMLMHAAVAGLAAAGCEVIDLGAVTTPGVALMIVQLACQAGLVVTASHNPGEWNGLKFLTSAGVPPPLEEAQAIFLAADRKDFSYVPAAQCRPIAQDASTHQRHIAAALRAVDVQAICRRGFRVVLDPVNGAGTIVTPKLLESLGCETIVINGEPTGRFAHIPEPLAENLGSLCQAVKQHRADIGFAQDPDGDRLAIVDETGRFLGEEYSVVLAARRVWSQRPGPAAVNLGSSRMIDDLAAAYGQQVIRTPVGEAYVAQAIREHGCVIGGEGNGGVIAPQINLVRDSLAGIVLVLDLLAAEGRALSHIVDELPRYTIIKQKFPCAPGQSREILQRVAERFADQRINTADGVRIDWPEGWAQLRPSNTEPILRIFAEAADQPTAQALIARLRAAMQA